MTAVAIIPARGGSKRIPKKNIREFHGKPMIAWSIEAAKISGLFDRIIVSTDDSETAAIAEQHGAEVPFRRPNHLANDHATTAAVMSHAASWIADQPCKYEFLCCIYATAPLLDPADLKKGLEKLIQSHADFAYAISEFDYSPFRALQESDKGLLKLKYPELSATRSQDLPSLFHDAGQFYWGRIDSWQDNLEILSGNGIGVHIPRIRAQDIDTEEDWNLASAIFSTFNPKPVNQP